MKFHESKWEGKQPLDANPSGRYIGIDQKKCKIHISVINQKKIPEPVYFKGTSINVV